MAIPINTPADIVAIREVCKLSAEVLDYITPFVQPGVTTEALDKLCHEYITNVQHAIPAPLNYCPSGHTPYPKATCISLNDVICHGIPDKRKLKTGDTLNIDITVTKDGYFGDTSRMFSVGRTTPQARRLCNIAYEAMWKGIMQVRPDARFGDIGHAVQKFAEGAGYSIVREFCGHGIGRAFHTEPQVLHYGEAGTMAAMYPGMIFTIEPMINAGRRDIVVMNDTWTVKTKDRSLSAQWEHTVLVTETGYEILTVSPGMPPPPSFVK